jgi:hypothetical protein
MRASSAHWPRLPGGRERSDLHDRFERLSSAFGKLERAGAHVRMFSPDSALYIHAKAIVRDPGASDAIAFVGSQNFSAESLTYNRELGIAVPWAG